MKRYNLEGSIFLGKRLRTIRLEYGVKQSDIAQVLHISRSTYSYYETGTTRPDPMVLKKPARYYNVPVEVFFSDEYPPKGEKPHYPEGIGFLKDNERRLILILRQNQETTVKDLLQMLERKI